MDKLAELKRRIDQYLERTLAAEKTALEKLQEYPEHKEVLTPVEILRREMLRHHTRSLILNEVKEWIAELREQQVYQLYLYEGDKEDVTMRSPIHNQRKTMTFSEADYANQQFKAAKQPLVWKIVEEKES